MNRQQRRTHEHELRKSQKYQNTPNVQTVQNESLNPGIMMNSGWYLSCPPIPISDVISRVFALRFEQEVLSTCFTMDMTFNGVHKQFIVTSAHNVATLKSGDFVEIYIKNRWTEYQVDIVMAGKPGNPYEDISVFIGRSSTQYFGNTGNFEVKEHPGLVLGQALLVLGFPMMSYFQPEMIGKLSGDKENRMMPFFQPSWYSGAMSNQNKNADFHVIYGHFAKGWSGSPVFAYNHKSGRFSLLGVVSGMPPTNRVIERTEEIHLPSGFGICCPMRPVIEAIEKYYSDV